MKSRNTIQRDLVMDAAKTLNHPTAEEIYNQVAKTYSSISRGTVYRNLGLLVEHGKLRKVQSPGSADHFDITLEGHYHIVCKGCGKVVDADMPYFDDMLGQIQGSHGFVVEEHDILFRGYCPDCQIQQQDAVS